MKIITICCALFTFCLSCGPKASKSTPDQKVEFNAALAEELAIMKESDQIAAWGNDKIFDTMSKEEKKAFKDSTYQTHQVRLEEIYNEYGYPGYDLIGEEGEGDFWLMTQHCDFYPEFQNKILGALKIEMEKGNANSMNYALLRDRVNINSGNKQIYGTQVTYIRGTGQAIPKPLADSATVNERRAVVKLERIENYLNMMTKMHFEMNKESFKDRGVMEPNYYIYEGWADDLDIYQN